METKNDEKNTPGNRSEKLKFWADVLWRVCKYFVIYPIVAVLTLLLLLYVAFKVEYYIFFVRVNSIQVCRIDETPVAMTIPVRYIGMRIPWERKGSMRLYALNGWRYWIGFNQHLPLFLSISRWSYLLGLAVFEARYEITDPAAVAKLTPIFRQCRERRLREIADEEREKNKSHERKK